MTRNRVAVVTGGLSGMGLAIARALKEQGHRVAVGSRRASDADFVAKQATSLGAGFHMRQLDVADQASVDDFIASVNKDLGPPDILVNAAGIYREALISGHSDTDWDDQIDINLTGPFRMIRATLPGMIRGNWGRIVNIASTAAHKGAAGYSAYCASKAGLIGLSKAVSQEGAPHNVTCVSVSPTWVDTPMLEAAAQRQARQSGISPKDAREALKHTNPQGRLVQADEIAALVAFCCSDACPALTDEDILVSAGADW